ncbi:sap30-binding protein [Phtheirospermum japonicum]|uniref:Sap30-binding protein n=1 Tax=Phtheirospermum japonicum TaxID=374723 RepID=A0A830C2J8_9LAMI|nr:sap30-binding protein [Phtheirospermum japonicum]
MPSEKKASEGIALLSMYGYEDDEMEDLDEEGQNRHEEDIVPPPAPDAGAMKEDDVVSDYGNDLNDNPTPSKKRNHGNSSASATPQQSQSLFSPPQQQQQQISAGSEFTFVQSKKSRLLIVDYGHEEGALSPEAEDGEIVATGRVTYGELLQTTSDDTVNVAESGGTEDAVMVSAEDQKAVDPLDKFLPPPPKAKCSEDLQVRIIKFLVLKTTGRSFNSEVRKKKEYRNPDFLLHAVTYQAIDQIGSCFPKDVFDPHGYAESDFYDELVEADMRREVERREQERKRTQKVDFASAGVQAGLAGVLNVTPASSDVTARDGRPNKKSKWDKVDVDQDSLAAVGAAHAALISAAKAGSGYSAFAQQRRREAEDKRSSDKRLERRS